MKPGVFAPKEEKALYAYFVSRKEVELDPVVMLQPVYAQAAHALLGMQFMATGPIDDCIRALQYALAGPVPLELNNFLNKYLPDYRFELEIAGGVSVEFPLSSDSVSLALAEALQSQGRLDDAIACVEELRASYPALLSLAELYSDKQDWSEVLQLTNSIEVGSEIGALLAIIRSRAHLRLGQLTAAKECLKPLTASRKYPDNLRFQALALRSNISLEEKAYSRAIADLEKILAENSRVPGILNALEAVNAAQHEAEQENLRAAGQKAAEAEQAREAKKAETLRLREEKAAEVLRVREEKAAQALMLREEKAAAAAKLREEKAAAKLAMQSVPVMQTGIINLSDESEAEQLPTPAQPKVHSTAVNAGTQAAGFYPDPEGVAPFRYWDGGSWTSRVRMKL